MILQRYVIVYNFCIVFLFLIIIWIWEEIWEDSFEKASYACAEFIL